jgi:hypothetical protein
MAHNIFDVPAEQRTPDEQAEYEQACADAENAQQEQEQEAERRNEEILAYGRWRYEYDEPL